MPPDPPSKLPRFARSVPRCARSCSADNHTPIHFWNLAGLYSCSSETCWENKESIERTHRCPHPTCAFWKYENSRPWNTALGEVVRYYIIYRIGAWKGERPRPPIPSHPPLPKKKKKKKKKKKTKILNRDHFGKKDFLIELVFNDTSTLEGEERQKR